MAWPQLGAIAAANAAAALGSPGYNSPGYDSPGYDSPGFDSVGGGGFGPSAGYNSPGIDVGASVGDSAGYSVVDYIIDLGGTVYDFTESSGNFNPQGADVHSDVNLTETGGTVTRNQSFTTYAGIPGGVSYDGSVRLITTTDVSDGSYPTLLTTGDQTVLVLFDPVEPYPGNTEIYFAGGSVASNGSTENTMLGFQIRTNYEHRTWHEYSSGSDHTLYYNAIPPASEFSGEQLHFVTRDTTGKEYNVYKDESGTLSAGTSQTYSNNPTSSGTTNKMLVGGRNGDALSIPASGFKVGLVAGFSKVLTTSEMQTIINLARGTQRIMRSPDTFVYADLPLTDDLRVYSDLGTAPIMNYNCSGARYWVRDNEVLQTAANTPYFGKVGLNAAYGNNNDCAHPTDLTGAGWSGTAGVTVESNIVSDPMGVANGADRVEFANAGDYIQFDISSNHDTQASVMIRNMGGANADFDFEIWDISGSPDHDETETGFTSSHTALANQGWTAYYTGTNDTAGTTKAIRITSQTAGAKLAVWGLTYDANDTDGIAPTPVTGAAANSNIYVDFADATTLPVNDWRISCRFGGDNVNYFRKAAGNLNMWFMTCGQNSSTDYIGIRGTFRQDEITIITAHNEVGGVQYLASVSISNPPKITDVDGDYIDVVIEKSSVDGLSIEVTTKAGDFYSSSEPSYTLDFNVFAGSGAQHMGLLGNLTSATDTTNAPKGLQISNFVWEDLS